jgi:ATP-dependent Clp protease ATP-binding subunit ClpA
MFERFADRARRVVVLAEEEARMLGHNSIGTEHILLGLIRESEGMAAQALTSLGVKLDVVRKQVEDTISRGTSEPAGPISFTPQAKKVLELSLWEALQLGHRSIGTGHILLGLLREDEGVAAGILDRLGAPLERTWQEVVRLLSDQPGQELPAEPASVRRARPLEPFDDLTDAALAALIAARAEARRVGLDVLEVGPLLVGLLSVEDGAAARVLGPELDVERLRAALGQDVEQPTHGDATPLPLSFSARTALQAVNAYSTSGAVGTGHIARALVGEDAIVALLRTTGVAVEKVQKVAQRLDGDGGLP